MFLFIIHLLKRHFTQKSSDTLIMGHNEPMANNMRLTCYGNIFKITFLPVLCFTSPWMDHQRVTIDCGEPFSYKYSKANTFPSSANKTHMPTRRKYFNQFAEIAQYTATESYSIILGQHVIFFYTALKISELDFFLC